MGNRSVVWSGGAALRGICATMARNEARTVPSARNAAKGECAYTNQTHKSDWTDGPTIGFASELDGRRTPMS